MEEELYEPIEFSIKVMNERYYNSDSSWGIYEFITDDNIPNCSEYRDRMIRENDLNSKPKKSSVIVGRMQQLFIGQEYKVTAKCEYNQKYNQYQYAVINVTTTIPKTISDQKAFLEQLCKPEIAEQIIKKYPNIVEDVVKGNVKDIDFSDIKGVGQYTWVNIRNKIIENYVISDIIVMLQPLGVTFKMIKRLVDDEPNPELLKQKLEADPWMITKISGIGWTKADSFALKLKPDMIDSRTRLVHFIIYSLKQIGEDKGHTWVNLGALKMECSNNVPETLKHFDDVIENNSFLHVHDMKKDNKDLNRVGLLSYYNTEKNVFDILVEKDREPVIDKFNFTEEEIEKGISDAENEQGFKYLDEQKEYIREAVSKTFFPYTGRAGSGKSSIMRGILKIYKNKGLSITCMALSAKASVRITEATGFPASTIHRALGTDGVGFIHNANNPLSSDVVFVDECSMISADLFLSILRAIPTGTRLIICGDDKQLPPIGFGNIFSDIIKRKDVFKVLALTEVMRQAQDSGILTDANQIRENKDPLNGFDDVIVHGVKKDMVYKFYKDREQINKNVIDMFVKSVKTFGIDNCYIVTPRRSNCINSADELNKKILDILIPSNDSTEIMENSVQKFKVGARVIQLVNNYEKIHDKGMGVFNGEVGYITKMFKTQEKGKWKEWFDVTFSLGNESKVVTYEKGEMNQLTLAYAITCHKCQGSSTPTLIGVIDNTHFSLLDSCMLYTLLTRAKERALLVAEPSAFTKCIQTSKSARQTWFGSFKPIPIADNNDKEVA